VANKNEKALQIFNGYLSEAQSKRSQPPIKLNFSILDEDEKFQNITLVLSGDPVTIIKEALRKCNLSTKNLPESTESKPKPCHVYPSTSTKYPTPEDLWQDLQMKSTSQRRSTKRSYYGQSLLQNLVRNRNTALERCRSYEKTNDLLEDEIEFLKKQTGAKTIEWTMSWSEVYFLRCIKNLHLLLKQSDAKTQRVITRALNGHSLTFGRSSFICVDGSIQFGGDDVPESWLSICREAGVRRFEILNVKRLVERVRELLGYANVVVNDKANLLQTTHQLQSLIVRISSQNKDDRELTAKLGRETFVAVANSYSSLAVLPSGVIQIPCNVNGRLLIEFLEENAVKSIRLYNDMINRQTKLDALKIELIEDLKLASLEWEPNISTESLQDCMGRLKRVDDAIRNQIHGLRLKISSNSNFHVLSDGTASIPVNFSE